MFKYLLSWPLCGRTIHQTLISSYWACIVASWHFLYSEIRRVFMGLSSSQWNVHGSDVVSHFCSNASIKRVCLQTQKVYFSFSSLDADEREDLRYSHTIERIWESPVKEFIVRKMGSKFCCRSWHCPN